MKSGEEHRISISFIPSNQVKRVVNLAVPRGFAPLSSSSSFFGG